MAYVRHGLDCKEVSPQPQKRSRVDAFGNSYDDWCRDYVRRDVDNQLMAVSTFDCSDYLTHTWIPRYVDNTVRPVKAYDPDHGTFDIQLPPSPDPIVIDEEDIFLDMRINGVTFKLVDEVLGRTIIPAPYTDITLPTLQNS